MQIQDNRKTKAINIQSGDVIAFYPRKNGGSTRYFMLMHDEARNRWLAQIMGDGNVYYREFNHPLHIRNHFEKHFLPLGDIELIKKSQVKVMFE